MKLLIGRIFCLREVHLWPRLRLQQDDNSCNKLIIVCGNPMLALPWLLDNDILWLRCNDGYDGLPEKIITLFNAFIYYEPLSAYTHILKVDSDNTIRAQSLESAYDAINNGFDYFASAIYNANSIGEASRKHHFGKVPSSSYWHQRPYAGRFVDWGCGGQGYGLSRRAINNIVQLYGVENIPMVSKYHIYEDLMVALTLSLFCIKPVAAPMHLI